MQDIQWIEIKISCDGELAEALAEVLGRFVSNGVVVENVTRFNPHTQENEPTGQMCVYGYLQADSQLEYKQQKIEEALWHLGQITPIPKPQLTPIQDENWMEAWKKHYQPIPIGEKILVIPAWHTPENKGDRLVIRSNPAMAFGTGTHPTTQLCLNLLEQCCMPGIDIIDVGCGSGILSIAALKMGASRALAVDTDHQAVNSTLENAALNAINPEVLETGKGSVKEILAGQFSIKEAPLVMANILAPIIIQLLTQGLGEIVTAGGILLLSGILDHQEDDVLQAAKQSGFSIINRLSQGDWVSLAAKNIR